MLVLYLLFGCLLFLLWCVCLRPLPCGVQLGPCEPAQRNLFTFLFVCSLLEALQVPALQPVFAPQSATMQGRGALQPLLAAFLVSCFVCLLVCWVIRGLCHQTGQQRGWRWLCSSREACMCGGLCVLCACVCMERQESLLVLGQKFRKTAII